MTRFALLKAIGGPGSIGFLVSGVLAGLLLLRFARTRRLGRLLLVALTVSYLALSVPAVASVIGDGVTTFQPGPAPPVGLLGDVFVLDGDNYQARAKRAAELNTEITPRTIWIMGGTDLRNALVEHGIPVERLRWGGVPDVTTYGQMAQMVKKMQENGISRAIVVASRIQTRRVAGLVRQQGIDAVVIASPLDREPPSTGAGRWIPSLGALALSREALYEWAAIGYYRWKGWIQ